MRVPAAWDPAAAVAEAGDRLPAMLHDARVLVETESPSADLSAVRRSAQTVRQMTQRVLGLTVDVIDREGVAHVRHSPPRPRVLILAHHDTVWPVGTIERMPSTVIAGVMRGPGCLDMKVGVVQAVHAMAIAASQLGTAVFDQVGLLVTGDEEVGSTTSRSLIEECTEGVLAALVLEAAADDGAVKVARKGAAMYRLEVIGRASHAGLDPEAGVNSTVELAHQVVAVGRIGDAALGTTVTPTSASAGSTPNTVPAHASVHIDVRTWTEAEQLRVDGDLRALVPVLPGAELALHRVASRPPFERAASADLFTRWRRAAVQCGVHDLPGTAVGGASDGNITAGLRIPTLDGLGAVGGGPHSADEHVDVEHIPGRTAVLATLLAGLIS